MRIAYISYEFPPDTAVGGIATYVYQIAKLMHDRSHDVEVFCASEERTISEEIDGIKIHRVFCKDRMNFNKEILSCFEKRHLHQQFDLFESPEFSGDGFSIKSKYPGLPLVVKLHTPWYLIDRLSFTYLTFFQKARFKLSGFLKGKHYRSYWKTRNKLTDIDYQITKKADQIHSPSVSLADIVAKEWEIKNESIAIIPNPYIPGKELLNIPIEMPSTNRVTYIGRLEIRKGLIVLAESIKIILKQRPDTLFRFVGKVQSSHKAGLDMKAYLLEKLNPYAANLEFMEMEHDDISRAYSETDICVFPSIWENFPNTCLEAMSSGRGIVACKFG